VVRDVVLKAGLDGEFKAVMVGGQHIRRGLEA
jgi:hypothetical protein